MTHKLLVILRNVICSVPMFHSEIYIPTLGWFDTFAPAAFLLMLHMVAITRLRTVKSYYPHGESIYHLKTEVYKTI